MMESSVPLLRMNTEECKSLHARSTLDTSTRFLEWVTCTGAVDLWMSIELTLVQLWDISTRYLTSDCVFYRAFFTRVRKNRFCTVR